MAMTTEAPAARELTYDAYMAEPQANAISGSPTALPACCGRLSSKPGWGFRSLRPTMFSFGACLKCRHGSGSEEVGPLEAAPELVVEVVSSSETQRILGDKIADYIEIGVDECWVVRPDDGSVEVLTLTPTGASSAAAYSQGEAVLSVVFAGLAVSVADVFAPQLICAFVVASDRKPIFRVITRFRAIITVCSMKTFRREPMRRVK